MFVGPKEFFYRGHNYFFSGHVPALANRKVDWLDGRNICREYCMDLVSMETQEENNLIFKLIQQSEYQFLFLFGASIFLKVKVKEKANQRLDSSVIY